MSWIARFRGASTALQVGSAAAALALIAGLMFAVYFAWFHSPYAVLYSSLRPADAAAIVAELDKKKTPYELRDGGSTILVPSKQVDGTRLSLAGSDLALKGGVGFEIFNKSDMGLTEFAQQITYHRALQGELERTIMALEGVDSARVHLTIAEPSVFRDDRRPSKASVTVIPRPGRVLPPQTIDGIQRLVAAAVPDLDVADVVVLDAAGEVVSGDAPAAAARPDAQQRAAVETYFVGRIRQALNTLDPKGQVGIAVRARAQPTPDQADPFQSWSPAARTFPLSVSLRLRADGPASSELRDAVARAIDFSPARGDAIDIAFVAAPTTSTVAAQPMATDAPARPQGLLGTLLDSPSRFWVVLLAPLLVLLGVAVTLHRRLGAPVRLSARQQAAYAERLQSLLAGVDGDVA